MPSSTVTEASSEASSSRSVLGYANGDDSSSSIGGAARSTSKARKHRDRASRLQEEDPSRSSAKPGKDEWEKLKVKGPAQSAFQYRYPVIFIPIPPALLHDPHRAADELMDTLLMRYIPQLSGVLISHHSTTYLPQRARIDADGAYSIAPAGIICLVWAPKIGMRLEGEIKLSTPSHISLLVHGIFNASITSAHLPSNFDGTSGKKDTIYAWHEYTEAEQDVKMESSEDGEKEQTADDADLEGMDDVGEKSTGYWVNKETGERLGGNDGRVVFTVVGMTIASHMVSLYGSLLRKPFSIAAPTEIPTMATSLLPASVENARKVHFQDSHQKEEVIDRQADRLEMEAENDEEEDGDDIDDDDGGTSAAGHVVKRPDIVQTTSRSKEAKRTKIGPRREGQHSGSESESDTRRDKKRRKK